MKTCDNCKAEYEEKDYRQKFCSRSCSASFYNTRLKRKPPGRFSKKKILCLKCGKENAIPISSNFQFCSRGCEQSYKIDKWENGEDVFKNNFEGTFPKWARGEIIKRVGGQCQAIRSDTGQRCTESRVKPNGNSILEIDHVDGDASNNSVNNISVLCPSCHAMTQEELLTAQIMKEQGNTVDYTA